MEEQKELEESKIDDKPEKNIDKIIKIDKNTPVEVIEATEVVGQLNSEQQEAIATIVEYSFQGPLPPPNLLEGYESIQKGLADRIVTMAEKDQDALIENRKNVLKYQARDSLLGSLLAFLTVIITTIIGGILLMNDKEVTGLATLFTGLGSIVVLFFKKEK